MRNEPIQNRSRVTYERLLEATRVVIGRVGWQRATTAMIAEESGVSIGSAYRYHPSIHEWREAAGFPVATHGIERVLELHHPEDFDIAPDSMRDDSIIAVCATDDERWPCATFRALTKED